MNSLFLLQSSTTGLLTSVILLIITAVGLGFYLYTTKKKLKELEEKNNSLIEINEKNNALIESRDNNISQLKSKNQEYISTISGLEEELRRQSEELTASRLEKLNYELSPHAFKNTLNTIKGMAYRMNIATDKFTDLLNYMLYETKKKQVSLAEEIDFIKQYIALNELMVPPWLNITQDFDEIDKGLASKLAIAPMMTIYFAENAFKHARQDGKDCFIRFSIKFLDHQQVEYKVTNKRYINKPSPKQSGVGSVNLEQRLNLLYKNRFSFEAQPIEDMFVASLILTLDPYENSVPVS